MKKILVLFGIGISALFGDNLDEIREKIVQRAQYHYDNKTPYSMDSVLRITTHRDCSSMVQDLYKSAGVTFPIGCISIGSASGMYNAFENKITDLSKLKTGDTLYFNRNRNGKTGIGHVATVIENPSPKCNGDPYIFDTASTSRPPKFFCMRDYDKRTFAGAISLEDVVNANGKPQTGECDNTQEITPSDAPTNPGVTHNTGGSNANIDWNTLDYTRPNFDSTTDTGLQNCQSKGDGFLYNPATAGCYYCSNCVSQASPVTISNDAFSAMQEINSNIKNAIKSLNKINQLQRRKILSMAANQAKIEAISLKLSQQKYEAEKSVKLQCINADMQINELNTKISNIEAKLFELSKKQ